MQPGSTSTLQWLTSRPQPLLAVAVVIAAGGLFLAAFPGAEDKATEHALSHVIFGLIAGVLAAFAAPLLPAPAAGWKRTARLVLVCALWLSTAGQLLEGLSAFGFEGDDETTRIEGLAIIHDWVFPVGFAALPLIAMFLILAVVSRVVAKRELEAKF